LSRFAGLAVILLFIIYVARVRRRSDHPSKLG
jgi:hypothetical protein